MTGSITDSWESDPQSVKDLADAVARLVHLSETVKRLNLETADADRQLIAAELRIHRAREILRRNWHMAICHQIAAALEVGP